MSALGKNFIKKNKDDIKFAGMTASIQSANGLKVITNIQQSALDNYEHFTELSDTRSPVTRAKQQLAMVARSN